MVLIQLLDDSVVLGIIKLGGSYLWNSSNISSTSLILEILMEVELYFIYMEAEILLED